jgi:hypothetical protein
MIMTRNKAQKTATRQRMAETGEPYSVARKASGAEAGDPGVSETPADSGLSETIAKQHLRETPEEQYLRETPEEQYLRETPEEQYLREAAEAGVAAADLEMLRVVFQARERAASCGRLPSRHGNGPNWPRRQRPKPRSGPNSRRRPPI